MRHHVSLIVLLSATLFSSHPALAQFSKQGPKALGTGAVAGTEQGSSMSLCADGNTATVGRYHDKSQVGAECTEMREERPYERQKFFLRKRSPDGVSPLPMEKYVEALKHMELMPQYSTVEGRILPSRAETAKMGIEPLGALGTWSWLGPGNIGGRTRALLIHPTTPAIMYAAGVTGGIWKSTDAGASWAPLADLMADIAVCTLAMDPHDPNVIYAGTGELIGGWRGAGIFKTTDGGTTWTQLPATNTSDFYYVNKIVVSPLASNRVYAGTSTGVWRSTDSGVTWTEVFATLGVWGGVTDLVIRSDQTTDVMLASDGNYGKATIYRNLDAGGTGSWTAVYTEPNMERTSLAIAPSNQGIMYALSANLEAGNYYDGLLAVFRSTDGGGTWTARVRNTSPTGLNTCLLSACDCNNSPTYSQGRWDNVIAVDPLDPNRVWAGGIDIFRSDDGGATWGLAGATIHVDNHAIVFHPQFNGTTNQQMYVGNDGGVWRTDNARGTTNPDICGAWPSGTVNWTNLNNGYGVTQFYYGLPYPGGATYFGGTQDNGTVRGTDGDGPNAWISLYGGDGGCVAVDPGNTNILYAENIYGLSIRKSTNGGAAWTSATAGIDLSDRFGWIVPFVMDPSNDLNLWTGGTKPWRTTNGATTWSQAGAAFTGGSWMTAIAVAPTDSNYVLSGLASGAVARSHTALTDNSSSVWAQVQPTAYAPYTSCLTFDPTNKYVAYATYSMFGVPHVWKSSDGGATFENIDGTGVTGIPDIPVNTIVVDPTITSRLYIGTDLGVFTSIDGGANWAVENTGFANVITEKLAITGARLFAFTHGRGAYRVALTSCTPWPTAAVSGEGTICSGSSASVQAALTGTGPWNVTWSDGVTQSGVAASPATRSVSPSVTTTYTVTALTDSNASCTPQAVDLTGSAAVTVKLRPTAVVSGTATICPGGSTPIQAVLTGTGPWNVTWSDAVVQNGVATSPATRSVTPSSTTTYTVTALTDASCTAQAVDLTGSAVVTVTSRPTAVVSGTATICAGGSTPIHAILTGTGPWNVTWSDAVVQSGVATSPATRSVTPSSTTAYTVTILSDANCAAQADDLTGSAAVTVNPTPSATITAPSTLCISASATASVADAGLNATYDWTITGGTITQNNGTSIQYSAAGSGNVDLALTVNTAASCSASSNATTVAKRGGDVSGNGVVEVEDIFYLVNFLFANGPNPPAPADANGDNGVTPSDIFYLVNYLFAGGPAPVGCN